MEKGWFTSISGKIELLIEFVQDRLLRQEMEKMTNFWTSDTFAGDKPYTTRKNIDDATLLIKKVLAYFGK